MKHIPTIILLSCLLSACASTDLLNTYESDELVQVQHNQLNDYTLLIYNDPMGQTRHVLRKRGICELVITYTHTGAIQLKERGRDARTIGAVEAGRVTRHINDLMRTGIQQQQATKQLSSI